MIEHAGGETRLFQLAVTIAQRADPAQVGLQRAQRPAAEHDAGIGCIVGDGIKNLSRRFCHGIDPLDPGVQNFQRRHHKIRRVEHVEQGAVRPRQPLSHNERQLRFHARADKTVRRHQAAIGKKHVVEQDAGVRLVDAERALHRLRRQPDLVALHDAPLGEFDLDPGLLDRIGVRNGDVWMIERQLPDLFPRLFRLIKPLGGEPDIVFG